MAEEQPPGAESSSEDGTAAAENQPPGAESSSEEGTAAAENQPPRAAASPGETTDAMAGGNSAGREGAEGADSKRRTLCRSSTDKVIAGVAGGIGAYFGIDAVIVRIAFIVLTFLGGAGPFLYLIGWLALPREESRSVVANALGGDSPHRFRSLLAVVLIGLGLLITANLSGELFKAFINVWTIAPYLALILIAAGVALVLWPGPAGRTKPTPARRQAPPAPPPAAPPPSTAAGPEWAAASPTRPLPPPAAPVRRQGRTTIGYLTVAVLLVYTGGAVILERLDASEVDIGVFFAIALAITGVGLLGSAYAVPARGLILLGVAFSAPLLLFAGADVPWGSGVGEVRVTVTDADELQSEYRHGIGRMVVDLSGLDPDETAHSVDLSLSAGEMLVFVPDGVKTVADVDVGAGNIRVWYGGPAPGGVPDLSDVRHLLEDLHTLPRGIGNIDDVEDYLDAYERYRGIPIIPDHRQSLEHLLTDGAGYGDEARIRQVVQILLSEARSGFPGADSENGLGLSQRITVPGWGEPAGELRLDIDVGIGSAEVVPATAPLKPPTTRS